jgi:CcmD family protein
MTAEEKYVAAAYLVVFVVVLLYVLIMAAKLQRLEREVAELADRVRERQHSSEAPPRQEIEVA